MTALIQNQKEESHNAIKWKIFIITHGPIFDHYYENDYSFFANHYCFFNLGEERIYSDIYEVINCIDCSGYVRLGKGYAESEAIYNIYRLHLYSAYEYVGFLHYDHELCSEEVRFSASISGIIEKTIEYNISFISFASFPFSYDFNQNIMMDRKYPNTLYGKGNNCWHSIISDYNDYFKKSINVDFLMTKRINLCSSFMCCKSVYESLMEFYSTIIESKKLDFFDTYHKYRFQGLMLERYIGCFSHEYSMSEISILHHAQTTYKNKKLSLYQKIITVYCIIKYSFKSLKSSLFSEFAKWK